MKSFKILISILISCLLVLSAFAAFATAEGEDDPVGETTTGDTTEPGETTTDPGEETTAEPEDPDAYHVTVAVNGDSGSLLCYFGGAETSSHQYTGKASDGRLSVRIVSASGYELKRVVKNREVQDIGEDGVCSFNINPIAGETYSISATTEALPMPMNLTVKTMGVAGVKVSYGETSVDYSAPLSIVSGTDVTLEFDVGGDFDAEKAVLTLNGTAQTIANGKFSFKITADTTVELKYDIKTVTFKITGPATANVTGIGTVGNNNSGEHSHTVEVGFGSNLEFSVSPALNYTVSSVKAGDTTLTATGGKYKVTVNDDMTISITTAASTVKPPVTNKFNVNVIVGSGGKATAGGQTIAGGNGTVVAVEAGKTLSITAQPDSGYVVDTFRVGGELRNLTNNSYTLTVSSDVTVSISFKKPDEGGENSETPPVVDDDIGVYDIDWTATPITVDISQNTVVKREVFERIASLPSGGTVEFRGTAGSIALPTGYRFDTSSETVDLAITRVASGNDYNAIGDLLTDENGNTTPYAVYRLAFVVNEPITIKLYPGAQFAGQYIATKVYDGVAVRPMMTDLSDDSVPDVLASNDGSVTVPLYAIASDSLLVLAQSGSVSAIDAVASAGGSISPEGRTNTEPGNEYKYVIKADEGYVIISVIYGGEAVELDEGLTEYELAVTAGDGLKQLFVTFDTASGQSSGNGKVIAVLVIVFVALAGAAALFYVKWRQEKF